MTKYSSSNAAHKRFRGPTPNVGKATQFKPGQSGNPGGRPLGVISRAYRELAESRFVTDEHGRTYAQLLAECQFREAMKGKTLAAKEITDRLEGKAVQPLEVTGDEGAPLEITLNVRFRDPEDE